jgi:single-strand DNA-binding protein
MADSNVTIVGNLTRDPELRFTAGGKGVASFGVAVNRRYQVNGEWQEKVSFFNVTAWDSLGENAAASLTKGTRIMVTGRLEQREYETTAGEKRNVVEIVADELGPSLRWARAEVERTQRTGPDGAPAGGGRPAAAAAPAGGGRTSDPVYGDEEPF